MKKKLYSESTLELDSFKKLLAGLDIYIQTRKIKMAGFCLQAPRALQN